MVVFKMMFILFLCFVSVRCYSADRNCDPVDELQCDDGSCISKFQWCDTALHCADGSDEMFCDGVLPCRQGLHFECKNKRCIPASAACDNFDDCHDNSDEVNCTSSIWHEDQISLIGGIAVSHAPHYQNFSLIASTHFSGINEDSVNKAVEYLLNKRNPDYGWGSFTPRAVIAISMASRVSEVARRNMQLVLKELNIQILQDLIKSSNTTLSNLAIYINALLATCQDPRHFQGTDLVARLRSETDFAIKSNTTIPLAFLTLCLSNATRSEDNYKLADLYNSRDFRMRTGSRALIVLAMSCIMHKDKTGIFSQYIGSFQSEAEYVKIADIYTQTLFKQASIAAGFNYPFELVSKQLSDGSFGDMLSTYYSIPVLLNSSFLDLVCNDRSKKSVLERELNDAEPRNEVTYSLWIANDKDPVSHSITIVFQGKKTVFDIMTMAASRDPLYWFLYEESEEDGKRVYSLAGIPNDIERGTYWSLYIANTDNIKVNSAQGLILLDQGVDKYFAVDKDQFIFWLKRNLPRN